MQKICCKNMQKYAVLYATYAEVYILHILHLNALPTLLIWVSSCGTTVMVVLARCPGCI